MSPGKFLRLNRTPRLAREAGGAHEERITREGQGAAESAPIRLLSLSFVPRINQLGKGEIMMATDSPMLDLAGMIKALKIHREAIDAAITNLMVASGGMVTASEGGAASAFSPTNSGNQQPTELPRGAFLGKSLPAAVKLYLSAVIKKQTIKVRKDVPGLVANRIMQGVAARVTREHGGFQAVVRPDKSA